MTTINIENLKCNGCANTIKKGLLTINGINEVNVTLEKSEVHIDNDNETTLNSAKEKLASMGYPEVGNSNTILHKAKSFVSCATGKMSAES